MDDQADNEILADVQPDRRAFVKRLVGVTAFAAPFIASYDLSSLSQSVAQAQQNVSSNQTIPLFQTTKP